MRVQYLLLEVDEGLDPAARFNLAGSRLASGGWTLRRELSPFKGKKFRLGPLTGTLPLVVAATA